jgi:1-phosphatidylinositol-3-phosphate 5-kinase
MQDIFKDLQTKFSKLLIRIFLVILIMCPEPPEAYERAFCIVAVP